MTQEDSGLLSELALVRMYGRADAYLAASREERAELVAACRREASVPDLIERILARTIYSQACSRVGPLRELLQNALDVSPRGARIDVRSGAPVTLRTLDAARQDREITVTDHGRGMRRDEILEDLLVPFRSRKEGDLEAIGEHGVGFLSALEIAPRIEITTRAEGEAHQLRLAPASARAPYTDFTWTLAAIDPRRLPEHGTQVRLDLEQPIDRLVLAAEISAAAGLVDPGRARIYVNGTRINTARSRMRKVASAPIGAGGARGELELFIGRGEGVPPRLLVTQRGLLVATPQDPFYRGRGLSRSLHADLVQAITAAGYGFVADLPRAAPLNKGRSAVAAIAAREVEDALTEAFERFILEDALYNRELLRGVDHRLSSVLDRLLLAALAGERASPPQPALPEGQLAVAPSPLSSPSSPRATAPEGAQFDDDEAPCSTQPGPTVAAPEEVVHFADALLDAPLFQALTFERITPPDGAGASLREAHARATLRAVLQAYRERRLRPCGEGRAPGVLYLSITDPLSQALFRRLALLDPAPGVASLSPSSGALTLRCVSRSQLLLTAGAVPGVRAVAAAITMIERIDAAVSAAVGLAPSKISVHQDLYGPDEMAHTDGAGISLNLSSPRIRALLTAVLGDDDPVALGALVDLMLHEKSHVSLASYIPRSTAEHGSSFYRRKDNLRRRFLQALAAGAIADPAPAIAATRRGLPSVTLPSPEALALAFQPPASLAA